ncbi:hypothetical protein GTY66_30395 [Streptomyces sp. SID8356]|uniref:hypothetical protein n=1 Tax=unclassified Streptomyces TaxID=2593676 RepID=UPI000363D946|nr:MULTISPECIES: hypothetical protein [unclassified Streptomyces]MYT40305.1 hypothetical protein [Streptomyces sp. SID8356]
MKKTERDESGIDATDSTVFSSDCGTGVPVERPQAADTVDFLDVLERQPGIGPS